MNPCSGGQLPYAPSRPPSTGKNYKFPGTSNAAEQKATCGEGSEQKATAATDCGEGLEPGEAIAGENAGPPGEIAGEEERSRRPVGGPKRNCDGRERLRAYVDEKRAPACVDAELRPGSRGVGWERT